MTQIFQLLQELMTRELQAEPIRKTGKLLRLPVSMALLLQMGRYGIVGSMASLTQFIVVVILVSQHLIIPIYANVIGYMCGFVVSFFGHKIWTFANSEKAMREAFPMFMLATGINFSINQGVFYILLQDARLEYHISLLIAMFCAAVVTFTLTKLVVFRD